MHSFSFGEISSLLEVIVGVLALIAAIIFFYQQKRKKKLSYQIISESSLLSHRGKLEGKLKVTYEGVEVDNIAIIIFKIINNGNVAITIEDYEKPLQVSFEAGNILSSEIIVTYPEELMPQLNRIEDSTIEIAPLLLNEKDYITLKCLLSTTNYQLKLAARIKDVSKIKILPEKGPMYSLKKLYIFSALYFFLISPFIALVLFGPTTNQFLTFSILTAGIIAGISAILLNRKRIRLPFRF